MSSRIWIGFLALLLAGFAFAQTAGSNGQAQESPAQSADREDYQQSGASAARTEDGEKLPGSGDIGPPAADTNSGNDTEGSEESNQPMAPNWMLPDLQGNQVSLYQEADQGRTTVMIFWATWCRNCKILLPKINDLKARAGDLPVAFYLLNIWEDSNPLAYVEKHDLKMQVILRADHVAKRFDVGTTPGVVVVDADRHIIYQRPNGISMEEVVSDLEKVLGIPAVTQRH